MIDAGSFDDLEALFYSIASDKVYVECLLFLHHVSLLGREKYTVINIRVLPIIHEAAHIIPSFVVLAFTTAHSKFRTHIYDEKVNLSRFFCFFYY